MAVCCDLEVDINGEETFMVDKVILFCYFSGLEICSFFLLLSPGTEGKKHCSLNFGFSIRPGLGSCCFIDLPSLDISWGLNELSLFVSAISHFVVGLKFH